MQILPYYLKNLRLKYASTEEKPKLIKRKILINKIYKLIFQQKVKKCTRNFKVAINIK